MEDFDETFLDRQKDLDADIQKIVDAIIKEEITKSIVAEILNRVAVGSYKEKQNESNKTI